MNNSKLESLLRLDRKSIPADGGTAYNRLIFAKSPYLLQHAENPVDWREWGEDAFTEARRRDLPLFVSIGYATCHWCHVMAKESFSDSEVAALLNESCIPVKVDREERPDIDEFYMTASRVLTGGGGWPLNIFIDHDRRPFFSITYLPKQPRHNTPGFMNLLSNISTIWRERREVLASNCEEICRSISAVSAYSAPVGRRLDSLTDEAVNHLTEMYDNLYGGFGVAVKFPMPTYLLFLLSRDNCHHPEARSMAIRTLDSIMKGGIHDHLGGGFHRYTVDQKWIIPHFEKMLYDQAMLIIAYTEAFTINKEHGFLEAAVKTARFVCNELLTPEGGFCAGLDADCEGEEGLYYTWKFEDLKSLLGKDCSLALDFWGATSRGDLDGRCILHQSSGLENFAAKQKMPPDELQAIIAAASRRLLGVRSKRERPLRDNKVVCSWNALMITALSRLSQVSGSSEWLKVAEKTARFMLVHMVNSDGRLVRNWLETPSTIPAFAEDYAAFTAALFELAACSKSPEWEEKLGFFGNELSRLFVSRNGEVAFCGVDAEKMPLDIPAVQDGVLPSTVALTAVTLIRLGRMQRNRSFIETGRKIIERYRGITEKNPAACLALIMAEEESDAETELLL